MSFLAELKGRNVIRVLIAYLAYRLTRYYAHIGDKDMTLTWIRKIMESDVGDIAMFVWDRDFAILHDTPEWHQWRKDAGLAIRWQEFVVPGLTSQRHVSCEAFCLQGVTDVART